MEVLKVTKKRKLDEVLPHTRFTLHLMGRLFELSRETLMKIRYFKDMLEDCSDTSEDIYVERSPMLFDHVLAYVVSPDMYPYPAEYAYELDFYGIEYEEAKLDQRVTRLERVEEKVSQLIKENRCFESGLKSLAKTLPADHQFTCTRCHKKTISQRWLIHCATCKDYCLESGCTATPINQYCDIHSANGRFCNHRGCRYFKVKNYPWCFYHINFT